MHANAIRVNDLFALGTSLAHTQFPQNVHYTVAGWSALGEAVGRVIDEERRRARRRPLKTGWIGEVRTRRSRTAT